MLASGAQSERASARVAILRRVERGAGESTLEPSRGSLQARRRAPALSDGGSRAGARASLGGSPDLERPRAACCGLSTVCASPRGAPRGLARPLIDPLRPRVLERAHWRRLASVGSPGMSDVEMGDADAAEASVDQMPDATALAPTDDAASAPAAESTMAPPSKPASTRGGRKSARASTSSVVEPAPTLAQLATPPPRRAAAAKARDAIAAPLPSLAAPAASAPTSRKANGKAAKGKGRAARESSPRTQARDEAVASRQAELDSIAAKHDDEVYCLDQYTVRPRASWVERRPRLRRCAASTSR